MSNDALPYAHTIHVRDHCFCLHAQRAARALARRYDEALRPFALTSGQFSLLMSLNRPEPPAMGSVSNLLAMDRTTLTANLKPLERRGLVEIRRGDKDARMRLLAITGEGRALLGRAMPAWERTQTEVDALLRETDGDALRADLRALG